MINDDPIAQRLGWEAVNPYPSPLTEAEVISRFTGFGNAFINDVSAGRVQFADEAARNRFDTSLQRRNDYAVTRPNFGGDVYNTATDAGNAYIAANPGMLAQASQMPVGASVANAVPTPIPTSPVAANVAPTASQGLLAPMMASSAVIPPFDNRSAELAGVSPDVYGQFLSQVSMLNEQHRAGTLTDNDYARQYHGLANQFGVNTVVRDGERVLYLNPGIQFNSAAYDVTPEMRDQNPDDGSSPINVWEIDRGQSATASALYPGGQPHRGFETEPFGSFIGDTRTRNESNFMGNLGTSFLNAIIGAGVGTLGSAVGGSIGGLFGGEAGSAFSSLGPRLDGPQQTERANADELMQTVLAEIMARNEGPFDIPAVENTPPETIEFPIDMPRLPEEVEETVAEGGNPAQDDDAPVAGGEGPAPPEEVFGNGTNDGAPDAERRWRYVGGGIFENIDTGERRQGGDGNYSEGEYYSGPESEDPEDNLGIFYNPLLSSSIDDGGIDFGPFLPGANIDTGIGSGLAPGGSGSGVGSGTGTGDGNGNGNGQQQQQPPQQQTVNVKNDFEKFMAQAKYQFNMLAPAEFVMRDYLAELMGGNR